MLRPNKLSPPPIAKPRQGEGFPTPGATPEASPAGVSRCGKVDQTMRRSLKVRREGAVTLSTGARQPGGFRMFGSRKNNNTTTVVARDAQFEGSLELPGAAHIEGCFRGTLTSEAELSVGPEGAVEGTLTAESVVIAGRVQGTVVAHGTLRVLKTGSVHGHVFYQVLEVASGGLVTGQIQNGPPETRDASPHGLQQKQDAQQTHDEQSGVNPAAPVAEARGQLKAAGER